MQFEQRISYSGEPYYIDTITGETQWGSENFFNTQIPLPKGYICLSLNGEHVYKYIGEGEDERLNSYSYSPDDFDKTSISETYKNLEDLRTQPAINEIFRRLDLFKNVAILLKRTPESIIDESLEYLAGKADVSPQVIIDYIQETELKELGENASLTAFTTIKRDRSFSSKRSIRELCGLNMREEELSNAIKQLGHLTCGVTLELMKEPVMSGCINGHTFDKSTMESVLESGTRKCPNCRSEITTTYLIPNLLVKNILEEFVEKYANQRGEIWNKIKETCMEYKVAKETKEKEKDRLAKVREEDRALFARVRESERVRLARQPETERVRLERGAETRNLREAERDREAREALLERQERETRVVQEAENIRLARQSENARLARQAGLERNVETDRLARESFELARVAREAERVRLREAAHAAREAERVRLHLERERSEIAARDSQRDRVEAETARLETEIQGFRYRERNNRRR